MNKKAIVVVMVICIILSISLVFGVIMPRLGKSEGKVKVEEVKQDKEVNIHVVIKEDTNLAFNSKVNISDMIEEINGELVEDKKINTIVLGEKEVSFDYINEDEEKVSYKFKVNIYDDVNPIIWLNDTYVVDTDYDGKLEQDIMCADNETSKPKCFIEGTYDTKVVGSYKLTYVAQDRSNNETRKNFTLKVVEPSTNTNKPNDKYINYSDIVKKYKNSNTKIGIDVSGYQGLIDFEAVKNAGVEFVFIKAGGEKGRDQEFYVDSKFLRNIEGFNNVGIPVGVYVYSYAKNESQAREEALWVLDQIKDYKVELPIVYDWENWSRFNYFEMSLYEATRNAEVFVETINSHGYEGSLYGSKNYLEKVWLWTPGVTWLAHYNESTSYQGDYRFWQRCENGRIDGITGNVDVDIWYLDR